MNINKAARISPACLMGNNEFNWSGLIVEELERDALNFVIIRA